MVKMILYFVQDGEPIELTEVEGNTLAEVFEEAIEYLEQEGMIEMDTDDEWERGDDKKSYWLTTTHLSGAEVNFMLEASEK